MITNIKLHSRIALLFLFVFLLLFFFSLHPIFIFDTDDWGNLSLSRPLYPTLQTYNPSKILPEFLMPLVSLISVKLLYPITNNYVFSTSFGITLCYSFFIILYIISFLSFIKCCISNFFDHKNVRLPQEIFTLVLLIAIVLYHFYPINSDQYLLYELNATCIFHYSIPAILNLTLLMLFICKFDFYRNFWSNQNYLVKFVVITLIYFSIFSNLLLNTHLVAFATISIAINLINIIKQKSFDNLKNIFKKEILSIAILFFFCLAALYEANGLRASSIGSSNLFNLENIIHSSNVFFSQLLFMLGQEELFFLVGIILLANIVATFSLFKTHNASFKRKAIVFFQKQSLLIAIICFVILWQISITVKTGFDYQFRPSVILCWYSLLLMIFSLAFIYLFYINIKFLYVILFVVFYLFNYLMIWTPPYKEINFVPYSNINCIKNFTNNLVEEIITADKKGISTIEVHVPYFDVASKDNFPLAVYGGPSINICLHRQGLIKKDLKITIIPDINKNVEYSMPVKIFERYNTL